MSNGTEAVPWTEEDVAAAVRELNSRINPVENPLTCARDVMAALAPRVAELQRAAKVALLRDEVGPQCDDLTHLLILGIADEIERATP